MKPFIYCVAFLALFACNQNKTIVKENFIDSLVANYRPSIAAVTNERDLEFWQRRVDSMPESLPDLEKYSSALATRFHIYGDINDLKKAGSIMQGIVAQYKDPGPLLSLAGYKMLQHEFSQAKKYIDTVIKMKAEKYAAQMMLFDAELELGDLYHASLILKNNYSPQEYASNFRQSKLDHTRGEMESAIDHMLKAAEFAGSSSYLRTAALSNAADLYVHDGNLKKAADLYRQCIQFNSSDFHSIMGLGWIALVHDKNAVLANKIFRFVKERIKSPDPLLKLSQAAIVTDSNAAKKYAMEFVHQASRLVYGTMYNKYLIQLYTGVLNDPASALAIAQKEIKGRATPQTYAWLAWSLFKNGRQEGAYHVFQSHVSGKGLEAQELYWMGKMMKGMGKGYTAQQFFKAAEKNKYDLSPEMQKDMEQEL